MSENGNIEPNENTDGMDLRSEGSIEQDRQAIFEERFSKLMNGFGEACETDNVEIAIAIAKHPEEGEPLVFVRGGEYDCARLMAYVLKNMKQQIMAELDTDRP